MRISEAKQCIMELFENTGSVVALISERGVGKTSAFQQCAEELGIGTSGSTARRWRAPTSWACRKGPGKGDHAVLRAAVSAHEAAVRKGSTPSGAFSSSRR
jgi:hypothetical protein